MNWTALLGVALGGALGSVARLGLSQWLGSAHPELNMGTLAVNALGGFLLGLWLTMNGNNQFPTIAHLPLALNGLVAFGIVGFCGGLQRFPLLEWTCGYCCNTKLGVWLCCIHRRASPSIYWALDWALASEMSSKALDKRNLYP